MAEDRGFDLFVAGEHAESKCGANAQKHHAISVALSRCWSSATMGLSTETISSEASSLVGEVQRWEPSSISARRTWPESIPIGSRWGAAADAQMALVEAKRGPVLGRLARLLRHDIARGFLGARGRDGV